MTTLTCHEVKLLLVEALDESLNKYHLTKDVVVFQEISELGETLHAIEVIERFLKTCAVDSLTIGTVGELIDRNRIQG